MAVFARPRYFGKRKHYPLSELVNYERALGGLPPIESPDPAEERFLTTAQVKQRYGVSDMWLWRREREAESSQHEAA